MANTRKARRWLPVPEITYCTQCVGTRRQAEENADDELPAVEIACTWAPQLIPGIGALVVPTCYGHIAVARMSPLIGGGQAQAPAGLAAGR
jgi:hypothetical protein